MSFGKEFELSFIQEIMKIIRTKTKYKNCELFLPVIDDDGIDVIIRKSPNDYREVQIKSRDEKDIFTIKNEFTPRDNYWFVFY